MTATCFSSELQTWQHVQVNLITSSSPQLLQNRRENAAKVLSIIFDEMSQQRKASQTWSVPKIPSYSFIVHHPEPSMKNDYMLAAQHKVIALGSPLKCFFRVSRMFKEPKLHDLPSLWQRVIFCRVINLQSFTARYENKLFQTWWQGDMLSMLQ